MSLLVQSGKNYKGKINSVHSIKVQYLNPLIIENDCTKKLTLHKQGNHKEDGVGNQS